MTLRKPAQAMMDKAFAKGYDELYRNHEADYTQLFNRVQLHLNPGIESTSLPTYQRLINYRAGKPGLSFGGTVLPIRALSADCLFASGQPACQLAGYVAQQP